MGGHLQSLSGNWKIVKEEKNNGSALGWAGRIPDMEVRDIITPGNRNQKED